MTVTAKFKLKVLRFQFTQFEVEEFNNYDQLVGVVGFLECILSYQCGIFLHVLSHCGAFFELSTLPSWTVALLYPQLPEHVFVKRLNAIQHVTIYQYPSAMLPHLLGWIILLVCGAMATVTGISALHGNSVFPNLALFIAPGLLLSVMITMQRGKPAKIQKVINCIYRT